MAQKAQKRGDVQIAALHELTLSDWNPRLISVEQFDRLKASIKRDPKFLEKRPVLARTDGSIYAGHMRFRAVMSLYDEAWESPWGDQMIPVDFDDVDERTAQERSVRDNNSFGDYQEQQLAELLSGLPEDAVPTLGFSDDEVQNILASVGIGKSVDPFSGLSADPEDRPYQEEADEGEAEDGGAEDDPASVAGRPLRLCVVLWFEDPGEMEAALEDLSEDGPSGCVRLTAYDEDGGEIALG